MIKREERGVRRGGGKRLSGKLEREGRERNQEEGGDEGESGTRERREGDGGVGDEGGRGKRQR